mmetsp:Transcript_131523/g.232371  ORF Transcript_131523/g.232371 Transcript_131523/m.232371 type:complete len:208 (-) Transcript_131523:1058-1681(-)
MSTSSSLWPIGGMRCRYDIIVRPSGPCSSFGGGWCSGKPPQALSGPPGNSGLYLYMGTTLNPLSTNGWSLQRNQEKGRSIEHSGHCGISSLFTQMRWKWCLQGVVSTASINSGSEHNEQYIVLSMANGSFSEANCNHCSFCAACICCFSGDTGPQTDDPVALDKGFCHDWSASTTLTRSPTTSISSAELASSFDAVSASINDCAPCG